MLIMGFQATEFTYLAMNLPPPPQIGSRGDCVPVLRVGQCSFDQIKEVLLAQKANGFDPIGSKIKGSKGQGQNHTYGFALVSLLTHLCRVGAEEYWLQLDSFSNWLSVNFGWSTVPLLFPYPKGLPEVSLSIIQQFNTILKGRYMGDFNGNFEQKYIMWRSTSDFFSLFDTAKIALTVPPVVLKSKVNKQELTVLECEQTVWEGVSQNFSNRVPFLVENKF